MRPPLRHPKRYRPPQMAVDAVALAAYGSPSLMRRRIRMDFLEANGVGLRYDLAGDGAKTLVLVHEMGGSLDSWD